MRNLRKRLQSVYPEGEASAILFLVLDKRFGLSRTDVLVGRLDALSDNERAALDGIVQRLETGEPVQYVLGEADFDGMSLRVGPGVLIPRPETEELVAWIASDLAGRGKVRILDIGTGSGCIALSLARRFPDAEVEAWDISDSALAIASDNARQLGLNVELVKRDALLKDVPADLFERYDVIVSNPPYICEREKADMDDNVLQHEPSTALFVPDSDPLLFYRAISLSAARMLKHGGGLYFEINREYGRETEAMMRSAGLEEVELRKDFIGNDRMVKGVRV
jgi:release factor glutamine methyltransferase